MNEGASMMKDRKRLIKELVFTGIAAPFVMLLLLAMHVTRPLVWVLMPLFYLGRAISSLIESIFPPQGGGWFQGLGTALIVDFLLAWIAVWAVLFVLVRLIRSRINRKKREA
jgi:hypothetical protein